MISKSLNIKDYLTFFIGIFSGFYIRVIGILCVSEIVLLLVAFYILLTRKVSYKHNKQFKILLFLSALAFLGSIISSIVNESTFINTAKWLFTIFLFVVDIVVVFWLLSDNIKRIVYYVFFNMVSVLLTSTIFTQFSSQYLSVVDPTEIVQTSLAERLDINAYLFAYQYAPIFLFLVAFLYARMPKLTIGIMFFGGVFFLFGDSRHLFLVYELAAVIMLWLGVITEDNKFYKLRKLQRNIIPFFILLLGAAFVIKSSYEYMAQNGILGEVAQYKYELQSSNNNDIVLGSRMITFEGLYVILKDPIWGYGPYAKDNHGYIQEFGRMMGTEYDSSKLLGGHSYLIQFWTYGGILSLPFWIYVIYICIVFIVRGITYVPCLTPFLLISTILLLYNILFSPFSNRIGNAFVVTAIILIINEVKNNKIKKNVQNRFC